jgi:hypothetical protein
MKTFPPRPLPLARPREFLKKIAAKPDKKPPFCKFSYETTTLAQEFSLFASAF